MLGYFFVENFPEASTWYAARKRYTASLAASSILGYLVGLGDRHPQNLLLQPSTGELVHIDLGIAFDQVRTCFFFQQFILNFSQKLFRTISVSVVLWSTCTSDKSEINVYRYKSNAVDDQPH